MYKIYISETLFTARYAETDQMGIIHHSCYPVWFEAGRTDFIRKLGVSYSEIEQQGLLLPLIELKCVFKGAGKYEDKITVKTMLKNITYTRTFFYYEVYSNNLPEPITTGETIHAWTTKELKPVNIKKAAPELYNILYSCFKSI